MKSRKLENGSVVRVFLSNNSQDIADVNIRMFEDVLMMTMTVFSNKKGPFNTSIVHIPLGKKNNTFVTIRGDEE